MTNATKCHQTYVIDCPYFNVEYGRFFRGFAKMSQKGQKRSLPWKIPMSGQMSTIWWFRLWDQFLKLIKASDSMCRDSEEREDAERDRTVRRL